VAGGAKPGIALTPALQPPPSKTERIFGSFNSIWCITTCAREAADAVGTLTHAPRMMQERVCDLALSVDGKSMVTISPDKKIKTYAMPSKTEISW
jgi:hypothetical protein